MEQYCGTIDILKSDIERYPELKEEIQDTFYDEGKLMDGAENNTPDDPVMHFIDNNAVYGRFEYLEELCQRLHVPYDRWTDADWGYDSYNAYYRPDIEEKFELFYDNVKNVNVDKLRDLIKDIDRKNTAAVGEAFLAYLDSIPVIRPLEEYEGYVHKGGV